VQKRHRGKLPVFVFDFGGVMIKWKNNHPIYDSIAEGYGIPRTKLRRVLDIDLPRLEAGEVSIRAFLTEALGGFEMRLHRGDSAEELWTEPFARLVKPRAGTVRLVESLRRDGYGVYLFSNTSMPHVRFLKRSGWDRLFDGILTSCELGSCKPGATAFRRALEKIGAVPSEVVFIDDKEENVKGAKGVGIRRALRFTSTKALMGEVAALLSTSPKARAKVDSRRSS
jgi:putative hydrolase of the HAD superfamily